MTQPSSLCLILIIIYYFFVLNGAWCDQIGDFDVISVASVVTKDTAAATKAAATATNVISNDYADVALNKLNKNSLHQNTEDDSDAVTENTINATDFARIELEQSSKFQTNDVRQQLLLHRQKRYLLFPEGSSFQMVFDLIIPIVDYTNFAIMGITCAVAWELPSKPPSELIKDVRTRLTDGTLGVVRRNDTVGGGQEGGTIKYVDTPNNLGRTHVQQDAYYRQPQPVTMAPFSYFYNSQAAPTLPMPVYYRAPASQTNWYAPMVASNQQQQQPQQQRHFNDDGVGARTSGYANIPGQWQQQQQQQQSSSSSSTFKTNWYTQQPNVAAGGPTKSNPYNDAYHRHQPSSSSSLSMPPSSNNNWWHRNKARIEQNWRDKQQKWSKYVKPETKIQYNTFNPTQAIVHDGSATTYDGTYVRTGRQRKLLQEPPKHRIYPVFGKRRRRRSQSRDRGTGQSDWQHVDTFERIHHDEHLTTRELLFHKIERLYRARALNGTACVMRALCESGQRGYNDEPQSFIMELLSAIFQLPKEYREELEEKETQKKKTHISRHYREAYNNVGDCSKLYRECGHGFWQKT